ncbi:MAG: hypothetical protein ACM3XN_10235 [Chloroflexota bacterium]
MNEVSGRNDPAVPGAKPFLDSLRKQVVGEMERARRAGAGGIGQRGPMLDHFLSIAERYVRARRQNPRRRP